MEKVSRRVLLWMSGRFADEGASVAPTAGQVDGHVNGLDFAGCAEAVPTLSRQPDTPNYPHPQGACDSPVTGIMASITCPGCTR